MTTLTVPAELASDRLLWALRSATKIDYRGKGLTRDQAAALLEQANAANGYQPKVKPLSKVPAGLGARPTATPLRKAPAKRKPAKAAGNASGVSAALRADARAFFLDADNVKKLYDRLFGATQIREGVQNDPAWFTDPGPRYVLLGGGCGYEVIEGYRKTAKNEAIKALCYEFKELTDAAVRKLMPPSLVAYCILVGNPVQAMQHQCETYRCVWGWLVAEFMELAGVKGVGATSRQD